MTSGLPQHHRNVSAKMLFRQEFAASRWFILSYTEQMGNIGSEVARTIRATEADDPNRKERAFARALELLAYLSPAGSWMVRFLRLTETAARLPFAVRVPHRKKLHESVKTQ